MRTPESHNVSLADLHAAGLRLRPVEAVTVARELTLRAHRGELPGIPSPTVLRFTSQGEVVCEGPVAAGQSVERAGRLLDSLLPAFDAAPEFRTPGALRLVVARSLGTLDLPAYRTLDGFADALTRFAADDLATVIRGLVRTWRAAVDAAEPETSAIPAPSSPPATLDLTISDVRRARRSTGLRLAEIAERSRIPASLLRELEWGYFVNWPAGHYGRSQLVRYARAAGLDEEVVTRAVWPILEEAVRARDSQPSIVEGAVIDDSDGMELAPAAARGTSLVQFESGPPPARREPARRSAWLAAVAIPALLAIGLIPAAWNAVTDEPTANAPVTAAAESGAQPPPPRTAPDTSASLPAATLADREVKPRAAEPPAAEPPAAEQPAAEPAAPRAILVGDPASARPTASPADLRADAAFSPAFASVGSAMFYHAEAGERSAIMRADTDTSGAILRVTSIVDDAAQNFHARPSPDGQLIAFDSDRDGERAVYVARADGRQVRRVSGEGFAAVPSWSPDGRTLAFVRAEPNRPRVWNLWTTDLETGETRRLTSYRVGQPWGAAWFPDGRRIAYSHEERLIIRSLDGGEEQVYKTPKKGHLIRTPAVSPDGRRVMFQVHRDGAWLLEVADGSMRRVLEDPTAEEFTWSPDGRRVAYHSRRAGGWGVWIMAAR